MNQGQRANSSGQEAEDIIAGILMRRGCRIERQAYIGKSIYGTSLNVDFKVYGLRHYPDGLIIECKWQSANGSVDEKLPYLALNIRDVFPLPAIVVLSGDGYRPGAKRWLDRQVNDLKSNLIGVMSLEEFVAWIMGVDIDKQTLC